MSLLYIVVVSILQSILGCYMTYNCNPINNIENKNILVIFFVVVRFLFVVFL